MLDRTADGVRLTVSDRGTGFDAGKARASGGIGLVSMRERVRSVRGILGVESEPDRGTTLTVEIPLHGHSTGGPRSFGRLCVLRYVQFATAGATEEGQVGTPSARGDRSESR
jgi:histidine kinase/DNA gyrase B/HSP90-like ATPase